MTSGRPTHREVLDLMDNDPARAADAARELVAAQPGDEEAALLLSRAVREATKDAPERPPEDKPRPNPVLDKAREDLTAGREEEAEIAVRRYLKQFPNDVQAVLMMAEIAARCELIEDADRILLHAVALAPSEPAPRIALARFRQQIGRLDDAIELLDQVNVLEPGHFGAMSLKASMLLQARKLDDAEAAYRELIQAWPADHLAWINLASILSSLGRYGESVASYRTATALKPNFGGAWSGLGNLRIATFFRHDVGVMKAAVEAQDTDEKDEVGIRYALFRALESLGEYDDAFANLQRANELQKRSATSRKTASRDAVLLKSAFTPELLLRFDGSGSPERDPIFILGMHRAGSTLVEQILASHPLIEGTEELIELNRLVAQLMTRHNAGSWLAALEDLTAKELREIGELYISRTKRRRHTQRPYFTDKMPMNWEFAGLIHLILPNAKIVDVRRHPLDCCFSIYGQHFQSGVDFAFGLDDVGRYYRSYVASMAHIDAVLPGRVHRIMHEELIEDFEGEVRRLLDYLKLPFDEACLNFHSTERAVHTPSSQQVRRPINRSGQGRWRNYDKHLEPLRAALGSVLKSYPDVPADLI
jgi:tetratricopeptide (TPR) repeat protein